MYGSYFFFFRDVFPSALPCVVPPCADLPDPSAFFRPGLPDGGFPDDETPDGQLSAVAGSTGPIGPPAPAVITHSKSSCRLLRLAATILIITCSPIRNRLTLRRPTNACSLSTTPK